LSKDNDESSAVRHGKLAGLISNVKNMDQISTEGLPKTKVNLHRKATRPWSFTVRHARQAGKTLLLSQKPLTSITFPLGK
jgi:hypothetical protein